MKQSKLKFTGPPLVLGYVRVSTDRQELSVEAQAAAISRAFDYHFHEQTDRELQTFSDPDTCRETQFQQRPQGKLLVDAARAAIAAGRPVTVIVTKVDRLGGSVVDVDLTVTLLQSLGVRLIFLDLNVDTATAMGRAFMQISAVFAQLELSRIRERIQTIMDQKRDNHLLPGTIPFGWNCRYRFADGYEELVTNYAPPADELKPLTDAHGELISQTMEDNLEEQKWIRHMVQCRQAGWGFFKIAGDLNTRGVQTKQGVRVMRLRQGDRGSIEKLTTGKWQGGQVAKILDPANRTVREWLATQSIPLAA